MAWFDRFVNPVFRQPPGANTGGAFGSADTRPARGGFGFNLDRFIPAGFLGHVPGRNLTGRRMYPVDPGTTLQGTGVSNAAPTPVAPPVRPGANWTQLASGWWQDDVGNFKPPGFQPPVPTVEPMIPMKTRRLR